MDQKELALPEIKSVAFEILKHFKAFCREHCITYYLSNGTLLGAVKHGGFIPWDDDIDVFVPREDYDKLVRLYQDDGQYKLFSQERDGAYCFPFAKLCDMTVCKEEIGYNNGVVLGLDIDIFPLDAGDGVYMQKQAMRNRKLMGYLTWAKLGYSRGKNPLRSLLKWAWMTLWHLVGARRLCERMQARARSGNHGRKVTMGCVAWPIYGTREIIPAEVFSQAVEVEFEGEKFPAPIGYDAYLRSLYGDYEKDPPLDKQKTHHNFRAYRL